MAIRIAAFLICSLLGICSTHGAALPCGGVLVEPQGDFFSPNYPDSPYPKNITCTWTIRSTGNRVIILTFPFMQLEYVPWDADCRFDSISVYDGPVSGQRQLGKLCGNKTSSFKSTRNELTVVFSSDSTFTYKGFHANYSFVDVPFLEEYPVTETVTPSPAKEDLKCGGELTNPEGEFSSPNYPHHYPNYANCTWTIQSTGNQSIRLNFSAVELEPDWLKDCRFDSIKVYDGPAADKRLLGTLCDSQTSSFSSTRNELTVVFSSDGSTSHRGFKADYTFVAVPSLSEYPVPVPTEDPKVSESSQCDSVFVEPKGEFFSPNYPEPYPSNAKCTWSIQSKGDHTIELLFPFILVEYRPWDANCRFDAISVYDGPLADDRLLGRLCGNYTSIPMKSTKSEMTVVFTSDSTFSDQGFHAQYSFVDKA